MTQPSDEKVRKETKGRRGSTKYGVLFIVSLVPALVFSAYGSTVVRFAYEREVGGHVRNAFEVNTPEAMISELNLTVLGMRRLGLTEGMYAAYFSWERTPDVSMAFQYEFLDQLINRTEAVILWRSLAYNGNSTPETLGDVYEQKMDNLRTFMTEGCGGGGVCTDWIARDVYFLYAATPYYFAGSFYAGSVLTATMSISLFLFVRLAEYGIRRNLGKSLVRGLWKDTRLVRKYMITPLYFLGYLAMALPFVFSALGP